MLTCHSEPPWNERLAPCVHEAGHAVIAHALGVQVISLITNPDGSGQSLIKEADPRTEVKIRVAGVISELRYCELVGGCPPDRHPTLSTSDDNERAWAAAKELCSGSLAAASTLLVNMQSDVETMVAGWWSRIERVAIALCEAGRLTSQPLADLLNGKSPSCG
jgi:hypothetical protein